MKPKPKFISADRPSDAAVSMVHYEYPYFQNPLHYHKELELAYIIEGYGTRYVGNSIKSFQNGDMVLVGEELTHFWKSDNIFYENSNNLVSKAIVVKFYSDFAGKDFLNLPISYPVNKVLEKAMGGLHITGKTNLEIREILYRMLEESPIERLASLIQILSVISISKDLEILSDFDLHKNTNPKQKDRMNKIIQHTMLNFKRNISLTEIAEIANLSKSAFCRYFKATTKKSYMDFLYDVRVEFACKLLLENNSTVMQVCYESGFNNPSAFSQIFKKAKGVTPNQYRKTNMITPYLSPD